MREEPDSLEAALAAVRADPADPARWAALAPHMIAAAGPRDLIGLYATRDQLAGDAVAVLFKGLFCQELLVNQALQDRLILFATHMPADNPLTTVLRFFQACIELYRLDGTAGTATLHDTARRVADHPHAFSSVPHLSELPVLTQGFIAPDALDAAIEAPAAHAAPPMRFLRQAASGTADAPLVLAACDPAYFARFAARFAEVAAPLGPVHIHFVGTGDACDTALLNTLPPAVGISVEDAPEALRTSPYYASARFIRAEALMAQYGRDLLMLDIDLDGLSGWDRVRPALTAGDVGCFAMPTLVPWLRYHAAAIHVRNSFRARHFLHRLGRLLERRAPGASWFIDQICLNGMVQHHAWKGDALDFRGLEAWDGYSFAAFVTPAGDNREKESLRTAAGL